MKSLLSASCLALSRVILLALSLSACGAPPSGEPPPATSSAPEEAASLAQAVGSPTPIACPQSRPVVCEAQCERTNCGRCCLARQNCTAECSGGGYAKCSCF
jgi:hypothetical protein